MKAKRGYIPLLILLLLSSFVPIKKLCASELIIKEVISGSLAERVGLKAGDKLLEINGNQVFAIRPFLRQLSQLLNTKSPFSLKVKRADRLLDFFVVPQGEATLGIVIASSEELKERPQGESPSVPAQDTKITHDKYDEYKKAKENRLIMLKREIANLPQNPRVYVEKSREFIFRAQSFDELELIAQLLERAKGLAPGEKSIYYNLGLLYDVLEDYEKAIHNLERFAKLSEGKLTVRDRAEINQLIEKNLQNLKRLEEVKQKMVDRTLVKIFETPESSGEESFVARDSPVRFLKLNNEIYFQHPKIHLLSRKYSIWDRLKKENLYEISLQKNVEREPQIKVLFKGKRFEIRYVTLGITPPGPGEDQYNFIYNWFLIKGTIEGQGNASFVRLTYFRQMETKKVNPSGDLWELWQKERDFAERSLSERFFKENLNEFYSEQRFRLE